MPKDGLISFPMKVVEGCGTKADLGLIRKPAELRRETVVSTRERTDWAVGPTRAMSSRYWMALANWPRGREGDKCH